MSRALNVFIKYNGHWDHSWRYVGCEMKGILVPTNTTYIGLLELVTNVLGIRGQDKSLSLRYVAKPGEAPVKIQSDYDVNFYLDIKKKDVHVLNRFLIYVDILDESVAEALPPEIGESNHMSVQLTTISPHSDEAAQHIDANNPNFSPES